MSLFLAGVPGRLKTLLDRLTNSTVPLNDTRVGYLDASIAGRASQTSVNTIDTNVDSILATVTANLDTPVSSSGMPVQSALYVTSEDFTSLNTISPGVDSGAMTTGTTFEVVSVTAPGILWWASAWRAGSFDVGTLNIRITIDGTVALTTTSATSGTTLNQGVVGVGAVSNSTAILMPLRFLTSMKVEILTSAAQTGVACAYGNTLYTLD